MDTLRLLSSAFMEAHPEDAARVLEGFSSGQSGDVLSECTVEVAADVLCHMIPLAATQCLTSMPLETAGKVLSYLPLERAAAILRGVETEVQTVLLDKVPTETSAPLKSLLRYQPGTVGALMDPFAFTLPDDITVVEAVRRIKKAAEKVQYYVYVVDRDQKLVGVLNLRQFILATSKDHLSSIMQPHVTRLKASTTVESIADHPDWARFLSLPVVDDANIFLGVLTAEPTRLANHRRKATPGHQTTLDTVLGLAELYWGGLASILSATFSQSHKAIDTELPSETSNGN